VTLFFLEKHITGKPRLWVQWAQRTLTVAAGGVQGKNPFFFAFLRALRVLRGEALLFGMERGTV